MQTKRTPQLPPISETFSIGGEQGDSKFRLYWEGYSFFFFKEAVKGGEVVRGVEAGRIWLEEGVNWSGLPPMSEQGHLHVRWKKDFVQLRAFSTPHMHSFPLVFFFLYFPCTHSFASCDILVDLFIV